MALHSDQFNVYTAPVPTAGSLSAIVDTEGYTLAGLALVPRAGALVAGTMQLRVGWVPGTLYPLVDGNNARVGLPFGVAGAAFSWAAAAVQAIRPWRYVQAEVTGVNQTNGANFVVSVKL